MTEPAQGLLIEVGGLVEDIRAAELEFETAEDPE